MNTNRIMWSVIAALVPGTTAMIWVWGIGVLANLVILALACALIEVCATLVRRLPARKSMIELFADPTTLLTAWLMALCMPPWMHPGVLVLAALAAIGLAKHAYGGVGRNIFNPAMVGYVVVLVSFPQALAAWPGVGVGTGVDGLSGATLLSEFKFSAGLTTEEFALNHAKIIAQQELIAYAFLAGGAALIYLKLIAWRISVSVLVTVMVCAIAGYDQGSSASLGSPWWHWTTGGLMLAAFFVVTDPVTHPRCSKHQIWFGILIGVIIYCVRSFGAYPDGIGFAVLLANCATPLLDRLYRRQLKSADSQVIPVKNLDADA